MNQSFSKTDNRGVAAIVLVVVIGIVALVYAKNVSSLGLNELIVLNTINDREDAMALAESCLDEALFQIRYNDREANDRIEVGLNGGTCAYTVEFNGGVWRIDTQAVSEHSSIGLSALVSSSTTGLEIDEWHLAGTEN